MIRQCRPDEVDRLYLIINEAAKAYEGELEPDCYHQPYMPVNELRGELKRVTFYGYIHVDASPPADFNILMREASLLEEWVHITQYVTEFHPEPGETNSHPIPITGKIDVYH